MTALTAQPNGPLRGCIRVPGDKSISHRALMIGALAVGRTTVHGLLEGADVLATAAALGRMGVGVARGKDGAWHIDGVGVGGLAEPAAVLDLGNSGTGVRLLMGAVATHAFTTHFSGDESLCTRPMERVAAPLRRMGAQILARSGGRLPLAVIGTAAPLPITYRMPVPSAQVKSAILLAGLNTPGETTVIETAPTRDHTERMLRRFAVPVRSEPARPGPSGQSAARAITVAGFPEFSGRMVTVPGDVSSAAFPLVAALLIPGSEITLEGVGINPLRIGLIETLREMGADITISETGAGQGGEGQGREGEGGEGEGEPIADITVRATALRGVTVPAARTPIMIDEYPILAVAAAAASGTTVMHGLAELRVKESDRLAAMAQGLAACGVNVEESEDGLIIHGCGGPPPGGATVAARGDHRIAMAFLVLGTAAQAPVRIDDGAMIATSFPGFTDLMNGLGTEIAVEIAAPEGP